MRTLRPAPCPAPCTAWQTEEPNRWFKKKADAEPLDKTYAFKCTKKLMTHWTDCNTEVLIRRRLTGAVKALTDRVEAPIKAMMQTLDTEFAEIGRQVLCVVH